MRLPIRLLHRALRSRLRRASELELSEAYRNSEEFIAAASELASPIFEALRVTSELHGLRDAPELALVHRDLQRALFRLKAICETYDLRDAIGYLEYRKRHPGAPKFGEERVAFFREWEPTFRQSLGLSEPRGHATYKWWDSMREAAHLTTDATFQSHMLSDKDL
jgi:hypothetical protein